MAAKSSESFLLESCFAYIKPFSWSADSGATVHVAYDTGLPSNENFENGKSFIYMRNDNKAPVQGVGTYQLQLHIIKFFLS